MNRIDRAIQNGEVSPEDGEVLKRISHDCEMVANGYEWGRGDGVRSGLRSAAAHLEVQADLCDRGVAPTADLMRCIAAILRAEAAQMEEEEE